MKTIGLHAVYLTNNYQRTAQWDKASEEFVKGSAGDQCHLLLSSHLGQLLYRKICFLGTCFQEGDWVSAFSEGEIDESKLKK